MRWLIFMISIASIFAESRIYLQAADEQNYPLARRLLGMFYIHGWP